jgi:hypothetical protein
MPRTSIKLNAPPPRAWSSTVSVHMDVHRLRTRFSSVSAVSVTRLTCTHSLVCFLLTPPLLYTCYGCASHSLALTHASHCYL